MSFLRSFRRRDKICGILSWFLLLLLLIGISINGGAAFSTRRPSPHHHHHHKKRSTAGCSPSKRSFSEAVTDSSGVMTAKVVFPETDPPYLALITEPCCCDSDANVEMALSSLHQAVATGLVDLVSVRVNIPEGPSEIITNRKQRLVKIVHQLLDWSRSQQQSSVTDNGCSSSGFRVVVSSDWMEVGIQAGAHGIHFKETHRHKIAQARRQQQQQLRPPDKDDLLLIVGTSTHTIESAMEAWEDHQADYVFAGTCFETESHPEKTGNDLEGPAFPAQVVAAFDKRAVEIQQQQRRRPKVLAIGGINASNCRAQTHKGCYVEDSCADGIATIRAVLQANDPAEEVRRIHSNMRGLDR